MMTIQNKKSFTSPFKYNRFGNTSFTFNVVCTCPEPLLSINDVCKFCLFFGSTFSNKTLYLPDGVSVKFSKPEPAPVFTPDSIYEFWERKVQPVLPNHEGIKILWVHCEVRRNSLSQEKRLKPKLVKLIGHIRKFLSRCNNQISLENVESIHPESKLKHHG